MNIKLVVLHRSIILFVAKHRYYTRSITRFNCSTLCKLQSEPPDQRSGGVQGEWEGDLQKCDYPIQEQTVNCEITDPPMPFEC